MRLFELLKGFYWRVVATPEQYARHIGVTIGENCLIDTRNWGGEPYLITIGDNVQITRSVSVFSHGGGRWHVVSFLTLMFLEKL